MSIRKQVVLYIHPDIKRTLQNTNTDEWIQTQIKEYQSHLKLPPIPNYKKSKYRPRLTTETLQMLDEINGRTLGQKVTNLYFNLQLRTKKRNKREEILKTLFPKNRYNGEK